MNRGHAQPVAAGLFGKVSTHGDFVARGLPPALVAAWDDWLQRGLQASRQQLGPAWLAHYLCSPVWRFALEPGVLDADAWSGVLMPSVDRVGRHFPLLLAAPGHGGPPEAAGEAACWYERLDQLARTSLAPGFVLARLEQELTGCAPPWPASAAGGNGDSWWWCEDSADEGTPSAAAPLVCSGMPAPAQFAALLDGDWRRRDWRRLGT